MSDLVFILWQVLMNWLMSGRPSIRDLRSSGIERLRDEHNSVSK